MTPMHKRAASLMRSLCALACGACVASANGPASDGGGDGGPSMADGVNGEDANGSSVLDPGDGGADAATPSVRVAPDGGDGADGGSSGADASRFETDGSPESGAETGADGAPFKDGETSDATLGEGAAKAPFKGVAGSDCAELGNLDLAWWYDWELGPTGCTSTPFVPMVWGHANEQTPAGIASQVSAGVAAGYTYVLGFNEPDNASQSNIPVATAISLWPSFKNPSVIIGSPATQGNATGLAWIQAFMTQVNADTTGMLRVDFIATHWYGWNAGACDPAANTLESWIAGIEAIPGNRPIWLTEWGCQNESNPNAATVQAFYAGALAMFAKHPRVVRYAWYQWTAYNELVNADGGALTTLGTAYADAPAFH
ncbi:MAG TPA: glycosyl hydrolase [Polyangiaceae bacterium]|nr:glycosyl hydrolase [Polyangiaceae bacterium]